MYKVGEKMPAKGKRRKGSTAKTEHKELAEGEYTPPKVAGTRKSLKRKGAPKKKVDEEAAETVMPPAAMKRKKKRSKR